MQYQKIIVLGQKEILKTKLIKRNLQIDLDDILKLKKILVLIGPRRAGKTFFLYQVAQDLVKQKKIKKEQIVYINFVNILFENFNLEKLLEEYFQLYPNYNPIFFFDEIQELENFEKYLLHLQSRGYQIFVTGSNSKLLSKEISTNLRGKYLEKFIFPLDFKEFLKFKSVKIGNLILEEEIGRIKNLFVEYMKWGGFPEIVLAENIVTKRDLINSYFNSMFYIDLVERYKIDNEVILKELIKKILKNICKEFSVHKIYNEFKSRRFKVGKNTLYNYLQYLENIFFVSEIKNYYKESERKIYLYDIGFLNLLTEEENFGQRLENIVYLYLKRNYNEIFFKKGKHEIDFYLPSDKLNLQVCYLLSEDNLHREIKPLQNEKGLVIYFDKNLNDIQIKGINIQLVNIIKLFLNI